MVDIYKWLFGERGKAALKDINEAPLPDVLTPYRERITKTERSMIAIGIENQPPDDLLASRIGGLPWWPAAKPYPRDGKGKPLYLLVQINFAEVPPLEPFPSSGLLQFFIGTDDLYGCDVDNPRKSEGFACVYHEAVDGRALDDFSFLNIRDGILPMHEPLSARRLVFEVGKMPVDCSDYRFEKLLPELSEDETLRDAYCEFVMPPAVRLGGYPTFTQTDPRYWPTGADLGEFTLLTVDTTDGIMWGDSGVAQFFMHEQDLCRRDFSKVVYNWDCC